MSPVAPPIELLLARLDGVRKSGSAWIAKCPAHDDRSPSLSIGIGNDGRILLHCHALCAAADVLAAIGLQLADLFPQRIRDKSPEGRHIARHAFKQADWSAALRVLAREATVVLIAANTLRDWLCLLTAEDRDRLALAIDRIQSAREVLCGS